MKPVEVVLNEPADDAGLLGETLAASGVPVSISRAYRGESISKIDDVSGLVVLGGAMGADDTDQFPFLLHVRARMTEAVRREIPLLGVCLGAQLLARVCAAPVKRASRPEIGFAIVTPTLQGSVDPLFRNLGGGGARLFQWHQDTFEIPCGGVLLAQGDQVINQAFRVGEAAWGVQFHPEATPGVARGWINDGNRSAMFADLDVPGLLEELSAGFRECRTVCVRLFASFAEVAASA